MNEHGTEQRQQRGMDIDLGKAKFDRTLQQPFKFGTLDLPAGKLTTVWLDNLSCFQALQEWAINY